MESEGEAAKRREEILAGLGRGGGPMKEAAE